MRKLAMAAGAAIGLLLAGQAVATVDHEAGVPLRPAEAAGAWSLQSNGQTLCVLDFGRARTADGYRLRAGAACAQALGGAPVAWAPTADGVRLVGPGGQTVMAFGRWSNSLFVTPPSGSANLQLRRGR